MNDILKQRLVGALILVALGVVFWPIIFVQPGDRPDSQQPRIPPRPEVNISPIEPPDQVGLRAAREVQARPEAAEAAAAQQTAPVETAPRPMDVTPEPTPQPVATPEPDRRTREEPPEKLVMDSQGVPVAWILQVASVSSAEKAEQLRQELLREGRKAYTRKVRRNGRDLYRIYIGPKFERARLEEMQPEIDREYGVKSLIVRYVP